jgi:glycosyltransferase involved in cell wall biosynthesis
VAVPHHRGAARDEAATLETTVRGLLAQDYPGLEVVVVDDRSSDGTGAIADRLAAADPRVTAVHVRELAAGWLGKVHALARGLEQARGALVLFTDADITFAPGALARAVGWMEARGLGLEKNAFAQGARFSAWRTLGLLPLLLLGSVAPFTAFVPVGLPWLPLVGVLALGAFATASVVLKRALGGPIAPVLLSLPLGDLVLAYVFTRATVLGVWRGGLVWRDTTYPSAALRDGRRVDM